MSTIRLDECPMCKYPNGSWKSVTSVYAIGKICPGCGYEEKDFEVLYLVRRLKVLQDEVADIEEALQIRLRVPQGCRVLPGRDESRRALDALVEKARPGMEALGFDTVHGATGMCVSATMQFLNQLPRGTGKELYFYKRRERVEAIHTLEDYAHLAQIDVQQVMRRTPSGHSVAQLGDWCVDWTARQFQENAPFPLIFTLPA